MKKILYVHSSDEMYGADKILLQLIEAQLRNSVIPVVVIPSDSKTSDFSNKLRQMGVKVYKIELAVLRRKYFNAPGLFSYSIKFLYSVVFLMWIILTQRIDIVHSNTLAVIPGAFAACLTGKHHIWHVHEIITKPKVLWKLTSWLAGNFSEQVVCVSESVLKHLCNGYQGCCRNTIVIKNGISEEPFKQAVGTGKKLRKEWGVLEDQLLVGMIGRVSNMKGQDYFLEITSKLAHRYPSLKFIMVGGTTPGQEDMMQQIVTLRNRLNLQGQVIIEGFRNDIPSVMDALDIFVLPSVMPDPFPTVVLEAMAMGKPAVANAIGGSTEMVEQSVSGFLVQPRSIEEIVDRIETLVKDPTLREQMGYAANNRFCLNFSLNRFTEDWQNLYQRSLSS